MSIKKADWKERMLDDGVETFLRTKEESVLYRHGERGGRVEDRWNLGFREGSSM